jgi:hypothetical protein
MLKKVLKPFNRFQRTDKDYGIFKRTRNILWAFFARHTWDCLVIHRRKLVKNPPGLIIPLLCGHVNGKFRCPPDLTIVLVHNYDAQPIMEKSLLYVGIKDYVVLKPKLNRPWYNAVKLETIFNYIKSGSCKTEYIMYCDSDDAILRNDPKKAIQFLQEENCDLLFSRTKCKVGYECMPQVKAWSDQIAQEQGASGWYLNSGVYLVRTEFFRIVLEAAIAYVTDDDISLKEYAQRRRNGTLGERLPEFPKGAGSDQVIFRYLQPQFYPRIKVDYTGRLALR